MWANIKNFFFPKTLNQRVQDAWHAGMHEGRSQVRLRGSAQAFASGLLPPPDSPLQINYPPLPRPAGLDDHSVVPVAGYSESQMREYFELGWASQPDASDAARWHYAMDWGNKKFAVCKREGVSWTPITTVGTIDRAMSAQKDGGI